jgi:glycolate oxidase iron-sulfur subunit
MVVAVPLGSVTRSSDRLPLVSRARAPATTGPRIAPGLTTLTTDKLIEATDQCVKCGLCLSHCPTYRLQRDEAESPRGRVALVQGLASGALRQSARADVHLASCLGCRACEPVCPSLVGVGAIVDQARTVQVRGMPAWRRWQKLSWLRVLGNPHLMRIAQRLAAFSVAMGLDRAVMRLGHRHFPRLHAYARLAQGLRPPPGWEPPIVATKGVALFLGCVSEVTQPATLTAAATVLRRLGIAVTRPAEQVCCGAMLRHNGFSAQADRLLGRNAAVQGGQPLVGIASACVAELRTHHALAGTQEICAFLEAGLWPEGLVLRPLSADVMVHEPCSHRNQLGGNSDVYRLLARVPGLRVADLPENALCCGAAGTYLLQHPETAQALLAPKLAYLDRHRPRFLVTTNPGCAMHLAAGLRELGLAVEVCHPVDLIARQLPPERP